LPRLCTRLPEFLLELDGGKVTTVRSIEGGKISTEVITYQNNRKPAEGNYLKQNGKLKYEPIKVVAPLAASKDMWKWMAQFIKGEASAGTARWSPPTTSTRRRRAARSPRR
jgi:hypothetical protein